MEFSSLMQAAVGLLIFFLLYNIWISWTKNITKRKHKAAPEPAGRWPIIGHLHLLRSREQLGRTLGSLADEYGPVFQLRLGMCRAIVVSSWEICKECFTTLDKVLATRPRRMFGKYLTYDFAMFGFAPYGPYWRQMRKIATLEVLSNHRLDSLKHVRAAEIKAWMKGLFSKNGSGAS